jgi:hypothetical protein
MDISVQHSSLLLRDHDSSFWENMLRRRNQYSFYQTPQWSEILTRVLPDCTPEHRYFTFSDGSEAILPLFASKKLLFTRKSDSLPWNTYGGLIGDAAISIHHLYAAARHLVSLRKPVFDVILNPFDPLNLVHCKSYPSFRIFKNTTRILPLDRPFERIWEERFHKGTRRDIRQTRNKGVITRWNNRPDGVETIKRLYRHACDEWQGTSTYPLSFFDALTEVPGDLVRIWIAEHDHRPVAGAVVAYGKGEVQYMAAARDSGVSKINASKLLLSDIIEDAGERGFASLNFGASAGLKGVDHLKEVFGGEETAYLKIRFLHPLVRFLPRQ